MSKEVSVSFDGSSLVIGLLGVAFVVLKLCHVIDWSWWWVLLPFYGGILLGLGFVIFVVLICGIATTTRARNFRWRR